MTWNWVSFVEKRRPNQKLAVLLLSNQKSVQSNIQWQQKAAQNMNQEDPLSFDFV